MRSKPLLLLTALLVFFQCKRKSHEFESLFGQENAIWTESIYFRGKNPSTGEKLTNQHIVQYTRALKKHKIKYAYLFAGPYGVDGHLPIYAFSETAARSVQLIKKYYPEVIILPWVGGVQNKTVYIGDSLWVKNALEDTQKLIKMLGVPGVHLDFEYILPGDPYLDLTIKNEKPGERDLYGLHVNEFHRRLRQVLPDAFISSVVVATSSDTKPWKRKTTKEELNVLVQYIDQLSFLYYDTNIHDQRIFEDNCIELIQDIGSLRDKKDIQYLVSIGTFLNVPELRDYRNLKIESIPNTLETIKKSAIKVDSINRLVDGISIYCDWTTDKDEWRDFKKFWLD